MSDDGTQPQKQGMSTMKMVGMRERRGTQQGSARREGWYVLGE